MKGVGNLLWRTILTESGGLQIAWAAISAECSPDDIRQAKEF
jgi:hypothetical protein